MERKEWAEQLLFGTRIEDKISAPNALTDLRPGKRLSSLPLPGRPENWQFANGPIRPFPAIRKLEDPRMRGRALLTFANHELLAIEMMAFALLRFPEAPEPFRRDLCATIRDEQRHFKLYCERAKELGAPFSDIDCSSFFWRMFQQVEQPDQFAAAMGLGIEQANLDHAHVFGTAFQQMGDFQTASIMKQVLMDEIQHVNRGLTTLAATCPEGTPIWDYWSDLLMLPLTPSRARGSVMNESARLAAGLDPQFILRLKNWAQTKGRPPNVWLFNSFFEERYNGSTPSKMTRLLTADQEALPLFMAAPHDAVLVSKVPSPAWLEHLRMAGLRLPNFIQVSPSECPSRSQLQADSIQSFQPWGHTAETGQQFQPLVSMAEQSEPVPNLETVRRAMSKSHAHRVCQRWLASTREELDPNNQWLASDTDLGRLVFTHTELEAAASEFSAQGHRWAVVKRAFGTAGRGQRRIRLPLSGTELSWVRKASITRDGVRLEPWHQRVLDFSTQMYRKASGSVKIEGHCHIVCSPKGQFWGAHIGAFGRQMSAGLRRFLFEDDRLTRLTRSLAETAPEILGDHWRNQPFGIDHFVFRAPSGELRLRPFLECNPRWTMGRVALSLQPLLSPGSSGLWLWQPVHHLRRSSTSWLKEFSVDSFHFDDQGRLARGTVCTNDPDRARLHVGLLRVEKTTDHCLDWFSKNDMATPRSAANWPPVQ